MADLAKSAVTSRDEVIVINHHQATRETALVVKTKTTTTTRAKSTAPRAGNVVAFTPIAPKSTTGTTTTTHTSVSVKSEPITFILDPGVMSKRVAEVFAARITEQTEAITEPITDATDKARRKYERAFYKAKPYAWRWFDGGRTGITPPRPSASAKYNHSGRLAKSIVAAYVDSTKEWRINFAANRWNPAHWSSMAKMQTAFQGWVDRVPVLLNPSADVPIRNAFKETWADVVIKGHVGSGLKAAELRGKTVVEALKLLQAVVGA